MYYVRSLYIVNIKILDKYAYTVGGTFESSCVAAADTRVAGSVAWVSGWVSGWGSDGRSGWVSGRGSEGGSG
jgi:hypothetical protein